jgi:alpha-beta hydrolase superfamily lysophospholipase
MAASTFMRLLYQAGGMRRQPEVVPPSPATERCRSRPSSRLDQRQLPFAHGLCGSRLYYDYLTTHLASRGFVVAAADFTGVTTAACDAGHVTASIADLPLDLEIVARTLHDLRGPPPSPAAAPPCDVSTRIAGKHSHAL